MSVTPSSSGELLSSSSISRLSSGEVLSDRYVILGEIGSGGFSVVYRAWDRTLKHDVAVKVLRADRASESALRRFRHEALASRDTANTHLVRIFDIGHHDRDVYLVMELVEGGTLASLLDNGPLSEAETLRIARQVLIALRTLHAAGIIHRDIKPSNLLIDPSGIVKLADFGLSLRLQSKDTRATVANTIVGTVEYISPEQALGGTIDERTDLYALGVVIFEMLTGRVPFDGDSSIATIVSHIHEKAVDVRKYAPRTSPWVAALVARLLEKKPTERFGSVDEVMEVLAARKLRRSSSRPRPLFVGLTLLIVTMTVVAYTFLARRTNTDVHLVFESGNTAAVTDSRGRFLWRIPAPIDSYRAVILRRRGAPHYVATVSEPGKAADAVLTLRDAKSGKVRFRVAVPDLHLLFPRFSDAYSATVVADDLNGDGADEALVTANHMIYWPSYTVMHEAASGKTATILIASGRHMYMGSADVNGDGARDALLAGPSNKLGFFTGLAAVDVRRFFSASRASDIRGAGTPDTEYATADPQSLLWYALLPRGYVPSGEHLRIDEARRTITASLQDGTKTTVSFDGFTSSTKSALPSSARQEARRSAYASLRNARMLRSAGSFDAALAACDSAIAGATSAGDELLTEWGRRVKGNLLVESGRKGEAAALFASLHASSPQASDIAYDAALAYHREGDLDAALHWYERGLGHGYSMAGGRLVWDYVEGIMLVHAQRETWAAAASAIDRLAQRDEAFLNVTRYVRPFLSWKMGAPVREDAATSPPAYTPDLARLWALEVAIATKPEAVDEHLQKLQWELGHISGSPVMLLALKADLLATAGRTAEAHVAARAAVAGWMALPPDDVEVLSHEKIIREHLQRAGITLPAPIRRRPQGTALPAA